MFDKAMKKSVQEHLEPGEDLLNVTIVQGKGMMKALVGGGVVGQAAVGAYRDRKAGDGDSATNGEAVQLANKMGLAITSQRLLIFKAGGAFTLKAKELITDVPIADVDSLTVGKGTISKPIMLTVRGAEYKVEAPKAANTDKLVSAFEQAKAGAVATV